MQLSQQFIEQTTRYIGEGIALLNSEDELIFENVTAKEENLYHRYQNYTNQFKNKKYNTQTEFNLMLSDPNPLPIKINNFYFSDQYLGKALYTTNINRNMVKDFRPANIHNNGFQGIIGNDPRLLKAISIANQIAPTNSTVLIRGESGTGKEKFAEAVHQQSLRKDGPFIAINCAAIPETLLESELFGYEGGSFTGASSQGKPGKFELADKGTIFLDEIGDMSTSLQAKLLRVLQDKRIERVGGTKTIPVDVRIVSATNRNLEELIQKGQFRKDLFYRINVIPIYIPELRTRTNDIELLVNYFLKKYSILNRKNFRSFSYEALELLKFYSWQGNVRELENVIEYCLTISNQEEIAIEDLPIQIKQSIRSTKQSSEENVIVSKKPNKNELKELLNKYEASTDGKKMLAQHLNISLATLYRWIAKYNL